MEPPLFPSPWPTRTLTLLLAATVAITLLYTFTVGTLTQRHGDICEETIKLESQHSII